MTAAVLADVRGPWWIIAGAAAALHGVDAGAVQDVDVLLGREDADGVVARLGLCDAAGGGSPLFRSDRFARWDGAPLPVEFMAGFHYRGGGDWRPVRPASRELVTVEGQALFVPAAYELAAMLRGFGRDKDLARAKALGALECDRA